MLRALLDLPSIAADASRDVPMLRNGRVRGDLPAEPAELVVYVHGWLDWVTGRARDQAGAVAGALESEGHDAAVVGFTYPSNLPLWRSTKAVSTRKGRELGEWVADYRAANPDTPVRLVAHSLGARAALACLAELRERGERVRSCSLLGAGVGCDTVAEGGRYYEAVRDGAAVVHNYHLDWEFTLEVVYRPAELGERALGVRGVCGTPPDNYRDHDVTGSVSNHFTYLTEDGGCLDRVIDDWE
ncbi:MAG: lipase family alpha/beta hydrolase [Halorientalis sp.]